MPDCKPDGCKLEHLIELLMPKDNPLWPYSKASTATAASIVDKSNLAIASPELRWRRFSAGDCIKAEVRSWLAWQSEP